MKQTTSIAALLISMVSLTCLAGGVDVRVDLGSTAPAVGGNWNTHADVSLKDFNTGLASGLTRVSVGMRGSEGTDYWKPANPGPSWLDSQKNAAKDCIWATGNAGSPREITYVVSGLKTDGTTYSVELVSSMSTDARAKFTVNNVYFDGSNNGLFYTYANGYNDGNWMKWSSIAPDAQGGFTVRAYSTDWRENYQRMNAIRILENYVAPPAGTIILFR